MQQEQHQHQQLSLIPKLIGVGYIYHLLPFSSITQSLMQKKFIHQHKPYQVTVYAMGRYRWKCKFSYTINSKEHNIIYQNKIEFLCAHLQAPPRHL